MTKKSSPVARKPIKPCHRWKKTANSVYNFMMKNNMFSNLFDNRLKLYLLKSIANMETYLNWLLLLPTRHGFWLCFSRTSSIFLSKGWTLSSNTRTTQAQTIDQELAHSTCHFWWHGPLFTSLLNAHHAFRPSPSFFRALQLENNFFKRLPMHRAQACGNRHAESHC